MIAWIVRTLLVGPAVAGAAHLAAGALCPRGGRRCWIWAGAIPVALLLAVPWRPALLLPAETGALASSVADVEVLIVLEDPNHGPLHGGFTFNRLPLPTFRRGFGPLPVGFVQQAVDTDRAFGAGGSHGSIPGVGDPLLGLEVAETRCHGPHRQGRGE